MHLSGKNNPENRSETARAGTSQGPPYLRLPWRSAEREESPHGSLGKKSLETKTLPAAAGSQPASARFLASFALVIQSAV